VEVGAVPAPSVEVAPLPAPSVEVAPVPPPSVEVAVASPVPSQPAHPPVASPTSVATTPSPASIGSSSLLSLLWFGSRG
jgi:hypothetical protein